MPQALRISSEMLMLDCVGMSPGFSSALGGGAGGVLGAAVAVGAAGGGGGSEAQPIARVSEERTNAAAYFIASSLARRAALLGRGLYTSNALKPEQKSAQRAYASATPRGRCVFRCKLRARAWLQLSSI